MLSGKENDMQEPCLTTSLYLKRVFAFTCSRLYLNLYSRKRVCIVSFYRVRGFNRRASSMQPISNQCSFTLEGKKSFVIKVVKKPVFFKYIPKLVPFLFFSFFLGDGGGGGGRVPEAMEWKLVLCALLFLCTFHPYLPTI